MMGPHLASETTFRRIIKTVLDESNADDVFISFGDAESTTLRFANNQVVQHVSSRTPGVSVRATFGRRSGSASTNRFNVSSLRQTVQRAQSIARLSPEDPEHMPSLERQQYLTVPSFHQSTADATPMFLAKKTKPVVGVCMQQGLIGAGIMSSGVSVRGVAASSGLFGYEESTRASFSLTASADDSSGWTLNNHRGIDELGVTDRTRIAVAKAIASKSPRELPAGRYPVILEPSAVAGIFGPMLWGLGARSYYKGNSPFVDKLGTIILDPALSVRSDPSNPELMGSKFSRSGLASRPTTWVDKGILKQLYYDRFTAKEHGVEPNSRPSSTVMTFSGPTVGSIDELVAQTERAILVTNFWYIRAVDRRDITMTGMTRDGTFLVENGKIVGGLRNFRFHESPLRCLSQVDAATRPMESSSMERGKSLLPALKLPEFYFSSVTRF